eukprot:364732-Chlamydomonas_euryale.AAC.5
MAVWEEKGAVSMQVRVCTAMCGGGAEGAREAVGRGGALRVPGRWCGSARRGAREALWSNKRGEVSDGVWMWSGGVN